MNLQFDTSELRPLIVEVIKTTLGELGWPPGRLALTEEEAAAACGVGRHVLRDLRLDGQIGFTKAGKKIVYQRGDLLDFLASRSVLPTRSQNVTGIRSLSR